MSVKLHLGCGEVHIDGYINIDIRHMPGVDKVDNIKFLRSFKENTIDVIYASHVLEHFSRWDYINVLSRWYILLKPGGILRLAVPDFDSIVNRYIKTKNIEEIMGLLYGGQDYEQNSHCCTFSFDMLNTVLNKIGFSSVERYDWRSVEHSDIDDCSKAYIPHSDFENGDLMSLNIEATR